MKSKSFPEVPDITVKEYIEMKKNNKIILVDHREPEEQEVSMIPDAIPTTKLNLETIDELPIVVYCTLGYRSGLFVKQLLEKHPYLKGKIFNLKGSILSWTHEGDKKLVDKEGNETKKVHVFGQNWDYSNENYEPVYFGYLQQGIVGLKSLLK